MHYYCSMQVEKWNKRKKIQKKNVAWQIKTLPKIARQFIYLVYIGNHYLISTCIKQITYWPNWTFICFCFSINSYHSRFHIVYWQIKVLPLTNGIVIHTMVWYIIAYSVFFFLNIETPQNNSPVFIVIQNSPVRVWFR